MTFQFNIMLVLLLTMTTHTMYKELSVSHYYEQSDHQSFGIRATRSTVAYDQASLLMHEYSDISGNMPLPNIYTKEFCQDLTEVKQYLAEDNFVFAREIVKSYIPMMTSDPVCHEQYAVIKHVYEESMNRYCNDIIKKLHIRDCPSNFVNLIKDVVTSYTPRDAALLLYNTLLHNAQDIPFVLMVGKLFDENWIPIIYNYDKSLFKGRAFSGDICKDQIESRLLLIDVALYRPTNAVQKELKQQCICYLEQALSASPLARSYHVIAKATLQRLIRAPGSDAIILRCESFLKAAQDSDHDILKRRTVPLVANLLTEIERNRLKGDYKLADYYKQELLQLHDQFQQAGCSLESQDVVANTISRLNSELKTFERPEMHRSPSMEKLYQMVATEFLVSTNLGSVSSNQFKDFSGTSEQNALHKEMLVHAKIVNTKCAALTDCKQKEVIEVYNRLIESVYELNKDNQLTLARATFAVAKDIASVIVYDFPVLELGHRAFNTITHPIEFCSKTLIGIKDLVIGIANHARYNSMFGCCTLEEEVAYQQACNQAIHSFFKEWQNLTWQDKKEVVAQLTVDALLNKAIGSVSKLFIKTEIFPELSTVVSDGISKIVAKSPEFLGNSVAISTSEAVAIIKNGGQVAVEVIDATPSVVNSAIIKNVEELTHTMARSGNGGNDNKLKSERDFKREIFQPLTNKEAREIAKAWGYVEKKPPFDTRGRVAFNHPKTKLWISHDKDGHKGGVWKLFDHSGDRIGTLDKYGNLIAG